MPSRKNFTAGQCYAFDSKISQYKNCFYRKILSMEITEFRHFGLEDVFMLRLKKWGLSLSSPLNRYYTASHVACCKQQRETISATTTKSAKFDRGWRRDTLFDWVVILKLRTYSMKTSQEFVANFYVGNDRACTCRRSQQTSVHPIAVYCNVVKFWK